MYYFSTNNKDLKVDFKEATIKGQPSDKGLFFPHAIPLLPQNFIQNINEYAKEEIAFTLIQPYVGNAIPTEELKKIISETINFEFPLVPLTRSISSLELFHGPTLAFKDVGARFMSRCLSFFATNNDKKITVLVATSGDTGGAVADAFYKVNNVDVVILYPSGKVSSIQELQLTTLGNNIHALEIEGSFDDCQQMVKQAFADEELSKKLFLTSANSINVARWLPQQFYYFFAYQQWKEKNNAPVISVPSGNFGNICAGLLAHRSGLPVKHFIAACNANDVVPNYLQSGIYEPKKAKQTISNAMDVGDPSNFIRILQLFDHKPGSLKKVLSSVSISDEETKAIIKEVFEKENYLLDPHGAVGYLALQRYLGEHTGEKGFFLETAHPVKFCDVIEPIIKKEIELPEAIQHLTNRKKVTTKMRTGSKYLKEYLMMK